MKINETKRFISFLLVVVMLFGMMPTTSYAIPYANVYLRIGDSYTFSGGGLWGHQWSVSNSDIVSISADGRQAVVEAKQLGGPVTITHTYSSWGTQTDKWTVMVVENYPAADEIKEYPIYFFLAKPGETPTSDGTYAPLPGHDQGSVYGTKAATIDLVQPNIEFRNVSDENIVKQYINLTSEQLNAIENFGIQTFYFSDGDNATYSSDQYDLIWYTICVRDNCCGAAGTHLHVDAVLSERVNPAELKLEKIIPKKFDEDLTFTFQLEKLQEDNNNKPINAVDTYFEPMQLSTTIPEGSTKAAITGIGDRQLTFGYYRLTENLSPEESVMWDADVWYIWIHTDGTLLFSKKYNTGYETVDVVPVNNRLQNYYVRYTDGVPGNTAETTIFPDKTSEALSYGQEHPSFYDLYGQEKPVREFYTFEGWDISADGNTAIYTAKWKILPGDLTVEKKFMEVKELPDNFKIQISGPENFTLTLDDADVEVETEVVRDGVYNYTYTWDLNDVEPGTYQADEYEYDIQGHTWKESELSNSYAVQLNPGAVGGLYLYNEYEINTYTVNWNDGEKNLSPETVEYLTVPKYSGSVLQSAGKLHTGWNDGEKIYGLYEKLPAVTENVTYTAVFTPVYIVTYTDGVDGEVVFEDQIYPSILEGSDTPIFDGEGDSTIPERTGYTFKGWNPEVTGSVDKTVVYTATWEANATTEYKVEHYFMDQNGNYPTSSAVVETLTGTTGTKAVAKVKNESGYKVVNHGNTVASGTIAADGSLVLKLYYERVYTLTFVDYNGDRAYQTEISYGTSVESITENENRESRSDEYYTYKFMGWNQTVPAEQTNIVTSDMTFTAQYEAIPILRTGTVNTYMNNGLMSVHALDRYEGVYVSTASSVTANAVMIKMDNTSVGTYQKDLPAGEYHVYMKKASNGEYELIEGRILYIGQNQISTVRIDKYSVQYQDIYQNITGTTMTSILATDYYMKGDQALVSKMIPTKEGYVFDGWEDQNGTSYASTTDHYNSVISKGISQGYILTAKWKAAKTVNVVVTINHMTDDTVSGKNPSIGGELKVHLTEKGTNGHADVYGKTTIVAISHTEDAVTTISGISFQELVASVDHSARAELNGYKVVDVTKTSESSISETVYITLQYDPEGFDLTFDVIFKHHEITSLSAVDDRLIPQAIDVKISYWNGTEWTLLEEHGGSGTGSVEVTDFNQNDDVWKGTGTYHVWGIDLDQNTPYYYNVEVVGVDLIEGHYLAVTSESSIETGFFPAGAFTVEETITGLSGEPGIHGTVSGSSITGQTGELTLTVTGTPYKVEFDPNGGLWKGDQPTGVKTVETRFTVPDLTQFVPTTDGAIFLGWFVKEGGKTGEQVQTADHIKGYVSTTGGTLKLEARWAHERTIRGILEIDKYYVDDEGNSFEIYPEGLPKTVTVHIHKTSNKNLVKTATVTIPDNAWTGVSSAAVDYEISGLPNDGSEYYVEVEIPNYEATYQNVSGAAYSRDSSVAIFTDVNDTEAIVNVKMIFKEDPFVLKYVIKGDKLGTGFSLTVGAIVKWELKAVGNIDNWGIITQQKLGDDILSDQLQISSNSDGKGYYPVWKYTPDKNAYFYAIRIHDYTAAVNGVTTSSAYNAETAPFTVTYDPAYTCYDKNVSPQAVLNAKLTPKDYNIVYNLDGGEFVGSEYPTNHVWSCVTEIPQPTKENHTFIGWTVTTNVNDFTITGGMNVTIPADAAADVTLTANWAQDKNHDNIPDNQQIFVTYEAGIGGSVNGINTTSEAITVVSGAAAAYGTEVTATTASGYTFVGWTLTSGEAVTVTYDALNPTIRPEFNSGAFGATYKFTANFAIDKNGDNIADEKQATIVFVSDGNGSLTGETTQVFLLDEVSGIWTKSVTPMTVTPVAVSGYAFDYWTTDGMDRVNPFVSQKLVSDEVVTYRAIFAEDRNGDKMPDKYQKTVIFRVTNGAWGTSGSALDKEDRIYTVNLWKNGQYTEDGRADIRGLIPNTFGIVADPGFITSEPAYWTPALPADSIVTGTEPAIYVLNFMTTVTYDDHDTDKDVTLPIRNEGKILVNPNGGTWNNSTDKQTKIVEVVSGEAYTLAPEPTRAEYVFDGWIMSEPKDGEHAYEFEAQWIHRTLLYYPAKVSILLDDVLTTAGGVHPGSTGFVLKPTKDNGTEHPLTLSSIGIYEGNVRPDDYYLYRVHGNEREKVGNFMMNVGFNGGELNIAHYSVTYNLNGGTLEGLEEKEIYFYRTPVSVPVTAPALSGSRFLGWEYNGELYQPGEIFTGSVGITTKAALTAKWEDLIDVTVNVEIYYGQDNDGNHKQVTWQLMDQISDAKAFQPVGDKMVLNPASAAAMNYSYEYITSTGAVTNETSAEGIRFTAITPTYIGLPQGGYTINSAKFNYDLTTTTEAGTNAGDLVFNMTLVFDPGQFNLEFGVDMDDSVPETLIPQNVNVKVLFWDGSSWTTIAQHKGSSNPPVSVAVSAESKLGTGFYPVWMYDNNSKPYDYRVLVTGFVYPDGSVKSAFYNAETGTYSDGNYTARVEVTDGHELSERPLDGAYYTTVGGVGKQQQQGIITVHVTAEQYDVIFDANGGKIYGANKYTEINQYVVPSLGAFTPIRDNYIFKGWYTNQEFTATMTTGQALTTDTAFYAKWEPIKTIRGNIFVDGLFEYEGHKTEVRSTCLPTQVTVYLQENDGYNVLSVTSQAVTVDWGNAIQNHGVASYEFAGLSDLPVGNYQIFVNETNYKSSYVNEESASEGAFRVDNYKAVFNADPTNTYVNVQLSFEPETFTQVIRIDASEISEGYRPETARVQLLYKEQNTNNEFNVINAHSIAFPYGLDIDMNADVVEATQGGLWIRSWNQKHLYDYKAELTKIDESNFNAEASPFTVSYSDMVHWDESGSSGPLTVTLTPKTYDIIYDYGYNDIEVVSAGAHTWSKETVLSSEIPVRKGHVFLGWTNSNGEIVTKVAASVAETTRVYAKWVEDRIINPEIGNLNGGGDGIPDIYQCVVEFRIIGGTWGEKGGSAPIGVVYNLKEFNANSGQWVDVNPVLGDRIPTNMVCVDPTTTQGAWSGGINTGTPVTGSTTYTYTYTHSVTVTVENGSVTVNGGTTYTNTTFTLAAEHSTGAAADFEFKFKPMANYVFKSAAVDSVPTTSGFNTSGEGIIMVDHQSSHEIHVIYDYDGNRDNVPDSYQKTIRFMVINGIWNEVGSSTEIVRYVTLYNDDGVPAENGTATISAIVPQSSTPDDGYKGGAWDKDKDPTADGYTVSGKDVETFVYTYKPIQFYDYHYMIHHIKQQSNGTYAEDLAARVEKSIKIEMNLSGTAFEAGKIPTLKVEPSDYKDYGVHYHVNTGAGILSITPVYGSGAGEQSAHRLEVRYDLDSHKLTYDPNGGTSVSAVTALCGRDVIVASKPTLTDHVFMGWKMTSGAAVGTIYQPGAKLTFNEDTELQAQWKLDVNGDEIPDETQVFVIYQATSDGAVSSTGEAVKFSGATAVAAGSKAITSSGIAFDGWVLTSGAAANVTFDPDKAELKPSFDQGAAGKTYIFTAQFEEDKNKDDIADLYQKKIIFTVTNGAWSTGNAANIEKTVTLMKDGKPAKDGQADITSLIPTTAGVSANAGYITTTSPFWSDNLPKNGIVTGTTTETYILNFYTTVTYDDYLKTEDGIVVIRPGQKILVKPNGSDEEIATWNGISMDQSVTVNVIDGKAYVLTPEAIRKDNVFNGWMCEAGKDGEHAYVFTAQWIHKMTLTYPVKIIGKLNDEVVTVGAVHEGSKTIRLELNKKPSQAYDLVEKDGVYTGDVLPGTYVVYRTEEGGHKHRVGDFFLNVTYEGGSLEINHYSVNYDLDGGTADGLTTEAIYFRGTKNLKVTDIVPTKAGFEFLGWKNTAETGDRTYVGGDAITDANGITTKAAFVAQWRELINITVHVEIDHSAGTGGHDGNGNRDEVTFELMKRNGGSTVVPESQRSLSETDATGYAVTTSDAFTTYTAVGKTYTNLVAGDYVISCTKLGYEVTPSMSSISTTEKAFFVKLKFVPDEFELGFDVEMADGTPKELWPESVNVRILYWDGDSWEIITQQDEEATEAPKNVKIDTTSGTGMGTYPVWMNAPGSSEPYYYRVMVSSFVEPGHSPSKATTSQTGIYTDGNYTAVVTVPEGTEVTTGGLKGAHRASGSAVQTGRPLVTISVETYDVVFDAMGGEVSGSAIITKAGLYTVPDLSLYTPVRPNYIFRGWYVNQACTEAAVSNAFLVRDMTLYAKWEPIQSISGTIQVDASGVRPACKPSNIVVQLVRYDGVPHPFKTTTVAVTWTGENDTVGTAAYEFTGLNALGSEDHYYQIQINEINYTTYYSNEYYYNNAPDNGKWSSTNAAFSKAVFSSTTPTATYVKAQLAFTPDTFTQEVRVDATSIGATYRPNNVKTRFMYVRQGTTDVQPAYVHSATDGGIIVELAADGTGSATEGGLRKRAWNEDRTQIVLYDYHAEVTQVSGAAFNEANPYYTVSYGDSIQWIQAQGRSSGILEVKLTPKTYNVQYVLDGGTLGTGSLTTHRWSYDTVIPAATKEKHIFLGWTVEGADITSGTSITIPGSVANDVTLTAHWTLDVNNDGTPDNQQVFIKYVAGAGGTVNVTEEAITLGGISAVGATATAISGYAFDGWTLTSTGNVTAAAYSTTNPALTPTFTNEAAGKTYTFTANFAVSNNGDDIPDYKQGFIVFEAGANGSLEGTTKQAFNLTGSGSSYSGTVTPETVTPKAVSGFAFDYWSIDGTAKVDPFKEQTLTGNQTVTYTAYFAEDVNGDKKPDKYQKLVKFQIVNGTWDKNRATEYEFWIDLDETGKADITEEMPQAIANKNFINGEWVGAEPSGTVTGDGEVTYKYRYKAYLYEYDVEHHKQNVDGTYTHADTTTKQAMAYINAADNGFVSDTILKVSNNDLITTYGNHYSVGETTTTVPAYTHGEGVTPRAVLKVYYKLDNHTLTYDSNGGSTVGAVTTRHGIEVTVASGPALSDHFFTGWKVTDGVSIGAIFQPGDQISLTSNMKLQAQWTADNNNDEVPDNCQKEITFKVINGTWNVTGNPITTSATITLKKDGDPSPDGTANIQNLIPTAVPNQNCTGGAWVGEAPTEIVSGNDAVTYTYRFGSYIYDYTVHYKKQNVNGDYVLAETVTETAIIALNDEGNGFTESKYCTAKVDRSYGEQYEPNSSISNTAGYAIYGQSLTLTVNYDLKNYTLTYDSNGGSAVDAVTTRYGIEVTVAAAPEKDKAIFTGWKAVGGVSDGAIFQPNDKFNLIRNMTLKAQWTADENNDYVADNCQKQITFVVINGTWNQTGGLTTTTACIDLDAVDGNADISSLIPTAVPNQNCTGGAWITGPAVDKMVSGSTPVTYTYRFESYIYEYAIQHQKQKVDGTYEVAETVTKSAVIELNDTNNGFKNAPTLNAEPYNNYGVHYQVNASESTLTGTAIFGQSLTLVVKYDLDTHTLTYVNGNGTSDEVLTVTCGSVVRVKAAPTRSGYTFQHWIATTAAGVETTTYAALSDIAITENTTLTALWKQNPAPPSGGGGGGEEEPEGNLPGKAEIPEEFTRDHKSFVSGYPDGTIRPEGKITRAEVAAIFYNLLTDEIRAQYTKDVYSRSFTDVKASDWFYTAVSAMSEMGVINGYPDGSFQPNGQITRAEFAAIASKFGDNVGAAGNAFSDINGHWGSSLIGAVAGNGWVSGYTDGTFKPNQKVTRAEAMAIINNVLHRLPKDANSLLPGMKIWPDNSNRSKWYYLTVQEASNGHDYERHADGTEYWTKLK